MGLGSARVVSLAEARAKANEARKLLAAGIDPISHRDADRMAARAAELHTATFKQVPRRVPRQPRRPLARQACAANGATAWRPTAKPLFDVAVGDIDVAMVLKVIEPEWKRAPQTMDRVRRRIGEVLGLAEVRGLRTPGPLPTRWKNHLDKLLPHPRELKPVVHHAALDYDAVPELYQKLIATDAIPELCLAFTILTATRRQEARGARWDEIDFKAKLWTVPPSRMKRKREHRVPLSAEALALIERLPRNGEYLFSVNGNGKPIVAMSLRKALHRHGGDERHRARLPQRVPRLGRRAHQRAARAAGGRAGACHRQRDRSGLCARRSAGEAPPRHAAMGDVPRLAACDALATRSWHWPGGAAMADAPAYPRRSDRVGARLGATPQGGAARDEIRVSPATPYARPVHRRRYRSADAAARAGQQES